MKILICFANFCARVCLVLCLFVVIVRSASAYDDPPIRVARLNYVEGRVSFQPGGESDWGWATLNRPMTVGDSLWTDDRSRAEMHIGSTAIRVGGQTSVSFLNLDDQTVQIQLNSGTIDVRVRNLYRDDVFEVDTPNLAFTLLRRGDYRITVDPNGSFTTITLRDGQGQINGVVKTAPPAPAVKPVETAAKKPQPATSLNTAQQVHPPAPVAPPAAPGSQQTTQQQLTVEKAKQEAGQQQAAQQASAEKAKQQAAQQQAAQQQAASDRARQEAARQQAAQQATAEKARQQTAQLQAVAEKTKQEAQQQSAQQAAAEKTKQQAAQQQALQQQAASDRARQEAARQQAAQPPQTNRPAPPTTIHPNEIPTPPRVVLRIVPRSRANRKFSDL